MSSLWTPGGEVPVDRSRPAPDPEPDDTGQPAAPAGSAAGATPDEAQMRERAEALRRMLLESPAADVIAQHAVGMYELAAIHLSQERPRLDDARLAIDALAAILDGVGDRLGAAGTELRSALPQLRLAFVEAGDRVRGTGTTSAEPDEAG